MSQSPSQLVARVDDILERIAYATLATVSDAGVPWNAPVYCAYDRRHHFYWGSPADAIHSRNIRANGRGAIVVYDSTIAPGTGQGVYMSVDCRELHDADELRAGFAVIDARRGEVSYWLLEEFLQDGPIRMYEAVPTGVWINHEVLVDGATLDQRVAVQFAAD
jgi:Pyridoxamine 5'-phosphate oxidase